jgi:putative endopeptidase
MNRLPLLLAALFAIAIMFPSRSAGQVKTSVPPRLVEPQDELAAHIDSTVRPGDDFFMFANGKWFLEHPIPPTEQSNGIWQVIQDTINAQVRNVCERSASLRQAPAGSNKQKIGDFYATGMDSVMLNERGLADLRPEFAAIDGIKDLHGLVAIAARLHAVSRGPLFGFGVGQDDRISSKNAVFAGQGGLSLPDRDLYFDGDAYATKVRGEFVAHLRRAFSLLGQDTASARRSADAVVRIETNLAGASRKRADTRDPFKNYNKYSTAQLRASTPYLDWPAFFAASGLGTVDSVIVGQPEFFTALNGALASVPLAEWKTYLSYHLLRGLASYADDATFREFFGFYLTTMQGVPEPKPRWQRAVEQTDAALGELIGQVYVAEYLPTGTKEKLLEIGNAIKAEYASRIRGLDWMSDATKAKALSKLSGIIMKFGYPDHWKDLSSMRIDRSSYLRNAMEAKAWQFRYMIAKYGKPVDRTEWGMEPQTYNAYYNPSNNEICVPGCNVIIPGYERRLADDALLYSIIGGSTIGHEITHGFDDQGSKYDEAGNLNNWWTTEDSVRFVARTKMIVRQFDAFVAVDTLRVNGDMTQGENIADLGGIMMGYEAFRKTAQERRKESIAGLTPDQRFFLGYALAWMVHERPEVISNQVRSDVHAPAKFRVLGPLANMPEFFAAFRIGPGERMWRAEQDRVKIW